MINLIRVMEDRRLLISSKSAGVTGENNAEILRFIFPEKISNKNASDLTKTFKIYNSTMEEPRSITLSNDEVNITDSMSNDTSSTIWLELSADNFLWMSEPYTLIFVPYPTFVVNPGGGGGTGPTGDIPTRLSQLYNDVGFITAALLPTKTSQLQNNSGFITSEYHDDTKLNVSDAFSGNYEDLNNRPTIPTVPTDISAFNNDSGYITENDIPEIPTDLSAFNNDVGFITEADIPDIPDIPSVPTKVSELENDSGYITENDIPEIPTKISDLINDSNFIDSSYHDSTKQDALTASDNIILNNGMIKTKDSQLVTVDCSTLTSYVVADEKIYILTNPSTLDITVTGNSERHFFVECGATAPSIVLPASWDIPSGTFTANTVVEISVLNGKAVHRIWQ